MNQLKREYLHIPVYAWLAGVGALAIALFYFMRMRQTSSASTAGAGGGGLVSPYPLTGTGSNIAPIPGLSPTTTLPPAPPVPSITPPTGGSSGVQGLPSSAPARTTTPTNVPTTTAVPNAGATPTGTIFIPAPIRALSPAQLRKYLPTLPIFAPPPYAAGPQSAGLTPNPTYGTPPPNPTPAQSANPPIANLGAVFQASTTPISTSNLPSNARPGQLYA